MLQKREILDLVGLAWDAKEHAISETTRSVGGAVILDENGKIWTAASFETGFNLYLQGLAGETIALFYAMTNGVKNFSYIILAYELRDGVEYPTGETKAILRKFAKNAVVIMSYDRESYEEFNLNEHPE